MKKKKFDSKKFGKDIIAFRTKNNLTCRDLCKKSKVSITALFRAELGKLFEINKVINICAAIGKKVENYIS